MIGRQEYLDRFNAFVREDCLDWVLVFYGLEGLGKTTLLRHLLEHSALPNMAAVLIDFDVRSNVSYQGKVLDIIEECVHSRLKDPAAWEAYQARLAEVAEKLERIHVTISQKNLARAGSTISASPQTANVNIYEDAKEAANQERKGAVERTIALAELAQGIEGGLLLFLDHWDSLLAQATPDFVSWIEGDLLPALRQHVPYLKVVIANHRPLEEGKLGPGVTNVELRPLSLQDAQQMMQRAGLEIAETQRVMYEKTGGNPLLLQQALLLWQQDPKVDLSELSANIGFSAASEWLFGRIMSHLQDKRSRDALERGGVLQFWNLDALEAVCGDEGFDLAWYVAFCGEPFVQEAPGSGGYKAFNRTVRQTLVELLWHNRQEWFRDAHAKARQFFAARAATESLRWRRT